MGVDQRQLLPNTERQDNSGIEGLLTELICISAELLQGQNIIIQILNEALDTEIRKDDDSN